MEHVLQELGLTVAAQSAAEAAVGSSSGARRSGAEDPTSSVAPPPAPPPAILDSSSDEPVAEGVQQLMLESFSDAEEGKERRAEQARTAAAAGFSPRPDAGGPTTVTGRTTVGRKGTLAPTAEQGDMASLPAADQARTSRGPEMGATRAAAPAEGCQGRNDGGAGGDGDGGSRRAGQSVAVEPAFEFSPLKVFTHYAGNTDTFVSQWMLSVVALWPQAVASAKRRRLNAGGVDCPGAGESSAEGTNAMPKTWMTRIRTACAFSDFIGRTVCLHEGDERSSDAEIDRDVRKFFTCLTPFTKLTIIGFLGCRRAGYAIAGSAHTLSAVTLKDYTSALAFLFGEAKLDGPLGATPLVKDCPERNTPWQMKGVAELNNEKRMRADPGTFVGNPMATADVKNFRGATNKEARQGGEQSLSSAPVTPEIMAALHAELILSHVPQQAPPAAPAPPAPPKQPAPSAPPALSDPAAVIIGGVEAAPAASPADAAGSSLRKKAAGLSQYSSPSIGQADMLTYIYYVVAFLTLARPVTINFMTFADVTFPDMKLAENFEFFQRCVYRAPINAGDMTGREW